MSYGKDSDDTTAPAQWSPMDRSPVHTLLFYFPLSRLTQTSCDEQLTASAAMFNHTGDSVILTHMSEHAIRIVDVPSLALRENLAAHVGGCVAAALDPRGRYLASGGFDSIVNLFDTSEWIAARTITVCECVFYCLLPLCLYSTASRLTLNARQAISDLSFSHDGEYLAIAGAGNYIDIVRSILLILP